jgi:hypothetical protein
VTQLLVFPMVGLAATLGQNLAISAIFTLSRWAELRAAAGVRGIPMVTAPQRP